MMDLYFFIKTLVLTFVFVLFLQIKIGNFTIEQRTQTMIQTSGIVLPFQEAAQGGTQMIQDFFAQLSARLHGQHLHKKKEASSGASSFHWIWQKTTASSSDHADDQ